MKTVFKLFMICGLALAVTGVYAQEEREPNYETEAQRSNKVDQLKVTFVQEALELNEKQSKSFWPVYNELQKEIKEKRNDRELIVKEMRGAKLSETDEEQKINMVNGIIQAEFDMAQLKSNYHEKFMKILPVDKVIKLYKAENDFKREVISKLSRLKEDKGGNRPSGGQGNRSNSNAGGDEDR